MMDRMKITRLVATMILVASFAASSVVALAAPTTGEIDASTKLDHVTYAPTSLDEPSPEAGFESIADNLVIVLLWQPATQTWDLYFPLTGDDTIGTLELNRAYFVYVESDCTLMYGSRVIGLYAGWNNIAWLPDTGLTEGVEPIVFALNKEYADRFPDWTDGADKIVDAVNVVFGKNTQKQFEISRYLVYNDNDYTDLFTNPEAYPEYYQDVGGRGGITYILLVHKDGISSQELKELYGSDYVNLAWTVHTDGKRYPTLLQANSESWNILLDERRSSQIFMPVHEIGHFLGLGVPDWYFYEYSDCTGVEPMFADYSIREDPYFSRDPMVGLPLDESLMEFCELNAAIIDRNLDFQYTYDDVRLNWFSQITKVYVTDDVGTPIPDATVKVFCVRLGCFYCSTQCSGATYPAGVPSTSVPEQTVLTDQSGYAAYAGPVGAWEMNESHNSPCIAKAIKVYHDGQSAVKVVRYIDLQISYVLDNSDEHVTHVILG